MKNNSDPLMVPKPLTPPFQLCFTAYLATAQSAKNEGKPALNPHPNHNPRVEHYRKLPYPVGPFVQAVEVEGQCESNANPGIELKQKEPRGHKTPLHIIHTAMLF